MFDLVEVQDDLEEAQMSLSSAFTKLVNSSDADTARRLAPIMRGLKNLIEDTRPEPAYAGGGRMATDWYLR